MTIIAAISNTQTSFPFEIISQCGAFATVSLIVSLIIAVLISESKYFNAVASSTLDTCSNPLVVTFVAIIAFKIMLIL